MKKILLILLMLCSFAGAKETFIFALHSYHEEYPWTKEQRAGFREVLNNIPDLYPLYSAEYLDTKRRAFDKEYENEFVHYMLSKYEGYHPDAIYVTDDNALKFIIDNREKLFPGVPVVFSGINNQKMIDSLPTDAYTGVREEKEIIPNIALLQRLFPSESELLILGDGSSTADIIQADLKQYESMIHGMNIRYINNQSLDFILNELKAYKGKNIILTTLGGFQFADSNLVPLREAIDEIVHAGDFHIFSMEDTFIQQGVLGGHADSGIIHGHEAAKMLLQIITHKESPLPEIIEDANGWIFDAEALKKENITLPNDIAAQSTFINAPKSFYHKHEKLIITFIYGLIAIVLLGSLMFIVYLYWSQKIIMKRKEELIAISDSLNKAQELAHLGNWVLNFKNNTLWWSDEIYRIFGLKPQEFKANYEAFLSHVHPDDRDMVQNAVNDALTNKTQYSVVHRIIRADGVERHVLEEGYVVYEDGKPFKMDGTVRDITEQQKAQKALESSEQKYKNLVENAMVGIYRSDLSGNVLYVNQTLAKIFGFDNSSEMIGQKSLMHYKNHKQREEFIRTLTENNFVSNYELDLVDHQSNPLPILISAVLDGDVLSGMIIDMRETKKSREEVEKLSKVVEQIDDMVAITDKMGIITYVNQAFCDHTGYEREEVIGKTPRILKSDHYTNEFYKKLWSTILSGNIFRDTLVNRKKNGDLYYENNTITPLKDDKNSIVSFVSTGKDVTIETLMHQEIERIATIDKLTGVYNRHKFEELYTLESERARRFLEPLSLILIDIDHFKSVNDSYGHDVGDIVLKRLADIVQENIRKIDIFARWGGEEFLVLSPNTDLENIQILAEKLRLAVENAHFPTVNHITISLGITTFREKDAFTDLFKRADQGLYYAKEHGRNKVCAAE